MWIKLALMTHFLHHPGNCAHFQESMATTSTRIQQPVSNTTHKSPQSRKTVGRKFDNIQSALLIKFPSGTIFIRLLALSLLRRNREPPADSH